MTQSERHKQVVSFMSEAGWTDGKDADEGILMEAITLQRQAIARSLGYATERATRFVVGDRVEVCIGAIHGFLGRVAFDGELGYTVRLDNGATVIRKATALMKVNEAVCALITNPQSGEVLAISRRNKPEDLNLPGGKVDPGESLIDACRRELMEETGLKATSLQFAFSDICGGEKTFSCTTFFVQCQGFPEAKEEGFTIRWIPWDRLLASTNTFSDYNRKLYEAVNGR